MAHFARLTQQNKVVTVIVVNNQELLDENNIEQESLGITFCKSLYGNNTIWVQTSFNGNFRKKFAAIGDTYDSDLNAFISPQPFSSWTLNTDTCEWDPPTPRPTSNNYTMYIWEESSTSWQAVE
jgi:hypothetical protein